MKLQYTRNLLIAGAATALWTGAALAQYDSTLAQDKTFYKQASEGSKAEIRLAHIALDKSHNKDIREFATKMIHDHTKLIENMKPVAQMLRVNAPSSLSAEDQNEAGKLEHLSGEDFNREYVRLMVEDHHKDLDSFRQEESTTSNPRVKQDVAEAEKVIQEHVDIIDQIAKNNNISTSGT